jgi:hypothetical protein
LSIPYGNSIVVIQGILSKIKASVVVQICQLTEEDLHLDISEESTKSSDVSVEIQQLLSTYADIFAAKVAFPPPRSCCYTIPLITEARLVYVRPYRHAPTLKDEIESQVQEMLTSDLIQHNSSSFCSPVLLVKKKDHTYRFCVDYRQLNAMTDKGQYPVPIIDELLDELHQASWFSSLDLCAGFHQIPMDHADCFKTSFQTRVGHYEFHVMSFGLTGAPHTFQWAMNSTLSPLLRKCVLVFFMIYWCTTGLIRSIYITWSKCFLYCNKSSVQLNFLSVHLQGGIYLTWVISLVKLV